MPSSFDLPEKKSDERGALVVFKGSLHVSLYA
ncbi:hypothetical protein RDI58_028437 [Solanum bulbocastanum]|uniref:Uncharacterized protein n=1 Tax=Solanum bulbocastanum TaxID=147425 RepID=A0AAN8XYY9_SOLBU